MRDLYGRGGSFSPVAEGLAGREVAIRGYMAPPLKAEAEFFVLTKLPMAICPFCSNELDWPTDIVLVRQRRAQPWVDFNQAIRVTGVLDLGPEVDEATGFVSRVRLIDATYSLL